ncbi:MAG: nucleotide pyrophosphohydrolase [Erysipelotrichales bacterium]|nr:nucleotide pyrophosphohydrolase [Erysipelotrichales bacterium]
MDELRKMIDEFRLRRGYMDFDTVPMLAKSIVIEAAELLECYQFDEENVDLENVKQELADVLIYTLSMAYDLDLDPYEIIKEKIAIVDARHESK